MGKFLIGAIGTLLLFGAIFLWGFLTGGDYAHAHAEADIAGYITMYCLPITEADGLDRCLDSRWAQ